MIITDAEVLKELKRVRSGELEDSLFDYPDEERDGRSDMQCLADELSWILSNYKESGHSLCEDLQESREILRETKNGKVIPLWASTLKPMYSPSRIQACRDTINEYKRLLSLLKRIHEKGFRGKWEGWM